MSKKLVSDLIVDYLARRDVEYVFGLCGHTVIGMLDAFNRNPKVKYISNRHEAVASTAADGYARLTHKASVGSRPDQRPHRRSQRLYGLHPHGGHRRRCAQLLLWPSSPPGNQYARRWRSV